jgi:hemoglobin
VRAVPEGDLDGRAVDTAQAAIGRGIKLFNSGNQEGCLRLYEGALLVLRGMVTHRPELTAVIDAKMRAAAAASTYDAAFALRAALDEVVRQCAKANMLLWERLGGQPAVEAVVRDFVALAASDPRVNFFRDGKVKMDAAEVKNLEARLVEFIAIQTGGPPTYHGRDMKTAHAGMRITHAEFDALLANLRTALKKHNVPQSDADALVQAAERTRGPIVEVGDKPLWDRIGGYSAVQAAVKEFVRTATADPKLDFERRGNYPLTPDRLLRLEQQLFTFISSVAGGPRKYEGRDMKSVHTGMLIKASEFKAAAGHLAAALQKQHVPQADIDELMKVVSGVAKDIIEDPAR